MLLTIRVLLSFVLTPGSNPDAAVINSTVVNQLCYQYRYDGRKRLVQKRPAGVDDWTDLFYNQLDQLVFSQDVLERGLTQRSFVKYDSLGRVIMTGLALNSTESPSLIQNVIDNWPENWEYRDRGGFHGYSNRSVPSNV
ncbi:hypothetical protein [Pedobacter antarcticus]|uniref:hypothetical protein n=1 Tax=Pedobacter antarcticus TaxID=34086 RepID=UPI00087F8F5B|nr:hypothetical protein [Pedobacter antarcticus]SDL83833.1 hypothetical protein SAMN04488084_102624 [Pedobacter antarcticus]